MKKIIPFLILAVSLIFSSVSFAEEYGVYVKVIEGAKGSFEEVVKKLEDAFSKKGLKVLNSFRAGVSKECSFKAHNITVHDQEYSQKMLSHGPQSAFTLPVKLGIYEDEKGINVAFANPASINRTVLGDEVVKNVSVTMMNSLSEIIASSVQGQVVNEQIGELRSKGRVGGMGGGDFNNKIEEIYKRKDSEGAFNDIAQKVKEGILSNKKGWKMIYALELDDHTLIYGVSKPDIESRAFKIAGEKRESKNYKCPGIDHVPAFPIEVIIYKDGDMVKVVTLDEMYRMKLYFEDAGNWAFMKNMAMPGEIEAEIVEMSKANLKDK